MNMMNMCGNCWCWWWRQRQLLVDTCAIITRYPRDIFENVTWIVYLFINFVFFFLFLWSYFIQWVSPYNRLKLGNNRRCAAAAAAVTAAVRTSRHSHGFIESAPLSKFWEKPLIEAHRSHFVYEIIYYTRSTKTFVFRLYIFLFGSFLTCLNEAGEREWGTRFKVKVGKRKIYIYKVPPSLIWLVSTALTTCNSRTQEKQKIIK